MSNPCPSLADRSRKEEYFEVLDETIRTNPYRKAATAMAIVMSKHGIESEADANNVQGPLPAAPEKKCALTKSLKLAHGCNQKLNSVKEDLQAVCSDINKTINTCPQPTAGGDAEPNETAKPADTLEFTDKATMTGHLLTLIGEAETIAKRIYETAVGLHVAEDFLRQPNDLKLLDFSTNGRIQIPNYSFNHASQLCLEWLHSTALKWVRGFKANSDESNLAFIKIFENFTKALKDFTESVCLANQVFRVLLYANVQGKECLQEYVQNLGHVMKNDIIMEIQSLRRTFDSIQHTFERLGWAASIAWMKYSGKNITVETINAGGLQVDRSRFQYKLYEGPQNTKGKKKGLQSPRKGKSLKMKKPTAKSSKKVIDSNSELNAPVGVGGGVGNSTDQKPSPASSVVNLEPSGSATKEGLKFKKSAQDEARKSKSVSDILKPKKMVKKKIKAKKTKAKDMIEELVAASTSSGPTENQLTFSVGDNRHNTLKSLTTEKISASSIVSGSAKKKSTQALTPPPKIPLALRQQFNAVFGTPLLPMKGVKPLKKKIAVPASLPKYDANRSQ